MTTFHPEYKKQANQETDEETTNQDTTSLNGLNTVASKAAYDDDYGRCPSRTTPSVLTLVLSLINPNTFTMLGGTRWCSWFRALSYKPEGHWFDSWWCHWNFSST